VLTIALRAVEVKLCPPSHRSGERLSSGEKLPGVRVTAILAREENPPEGVEAARSFSVCAVG
jgi:hypothetical protein